MNVLVREVLFPSFHIALSSSSYLSTLSIPCSLLVVFLALLHALEKNSQYSFDAFFQKRFFLSIIETAWKISRWCFVLRFVVS